MDEIKKTAEEKEISKQAATADGKSRRGNDATKAENKKTAKAALKNMWSGKHYALLILICAILKLRFNAHVVKSEAFKQQKKKGAMLVLCNHTSALDFGYFTSPFFFKKISFVVAENMMYSTPIFAKVIKGYHAITKKQYFADYSCIKNMKRYLDAGISVIICPEGKVSADGVTGVIPDSIARLVKWLGYPVATVLTKGAGLTRPKWAHNGRTGKIVSYCDMLMTADEVKTLSTNNIFEKVKKGLAHNEHKYQLESGLKFRGKKYAEGLERLLYRCPKCGAEFKITAKDDVLTCEACGNAVRYPHTGGLEPIGDSVCPERIDLWYENERAEVAEEIKNPDFRLASPVSLFLENETKNGYRFVAAGVLSIDRTEIEFKSTLETRPVNISSEYKIGDMNYDLNAEGEREPVEDEFKRLVFPVKHFVTIANIPGSSLDIYDEKHTYRMMFSAELASTKYALAVEELSRERGDI